jgi:hypothetical protein
VMVTKAKLEMKMERWQEKESSGIDQLRQGEGIN